MVRKVPKTDCWRPVVAQRIMAMGVSGDMPLAMSASEIVLTLVTPISTTLVPGARATCPQSTSGSTLSGSSWPVTTVKLEQWSRWVSGMPA